LETCIFQGYPIHHKDQIYETLQKFLLTNPPSTTQSDQQSFYAVSPIATKEGFIIQYLPQHQSKVQRIRARLQDRLVAAQAVWGHPTSPLDSSDALPSTTWKAIPELPIAGLPAPMSIPHDDHPASARPPGLQQNAVMVQSQGLVPFTLYKIFELQFTMPFCASPSLPSQINCLCTHTSSQHIVNIPGHHNLYHWLLAFQQLFQNMVWD